jgi:hypothetical protein
MSSRVDLSKERVVEQGGECRHIEVPASYQYVWGAGLSFHSDCIFMVRKVTKL